jgi:hypothetical protein
VKGEEAQRFWADDRWMNGHQRAGTIEVVDSVDVLARLLSRGRITQWEYYETIGRMRAAGICFIPVTKAEILSALTAAKLDNGKLIEDSTLRNLRQGLAASLLRAHILQRPAAIGEAIQPGEVGFLLWIGKRALSSSRAASCDSVSIF